MEDKGAYSWIVVNGPKVFVIFRRLLKKITEKSNCSVKSLSKKVSNRKGCSTSMLYDILGGRTKWIPLPLINNLLSILREFNEVKEARELRDNFLQSIKFLKSAPRSTVEIKAVKKLSTELAELCGIHAADGSLTLGINIESKDEKFLTEIKNKLQLNFPHLKISKIRKREDKYIISVYLNHTLREGVLKYLNKNGISFSTHYVLEFIDSDKRSMGHLKKLIYKLFGYSSKITPREKGEGYYIFFSNKIIGRYLKNIFNFPIGKKSNIVNAPDLVKKAPFFIQRAFVRGLLQFDGSVRRNGNVAFSTNSRQLLDFFISVINKDKLKGIIWERKNRKMELSFESPGAKQWLSYFIKNTLKYQRLYEHNYGFREKVKSIEGATKIFDKVFPSNNRSILTFPELIRTVLKLREFTRYQISEKLNTHYKSLSVMLEVLENAKIIKIDSVEMLDRFKGKSDKITFNGNIKEWRIPLLQVLQGDR